MARPHRPSHYLLHAAAKERAGEAWRRKAPPDPDDALAASLYATARPWPDCGLVIGECVCNSTLTIDECEVVEEAT